MKPEPYISPVPIPPGSTIMDTILLKLALSADIDYGTLTLLISGNAPLTDEIAEKLSKHLGYSPEFWQNLEVNYRASLARQKHKLKE